MEARGGRRRRSLDVAEALLATAIVFAPLAVGTVQLWSLAVLVGLTAAAAMAAALGRPRRIPWPVWAALATAAWVGFQAVPLPPWCLSLLSPRAAELLDFSLLPGAWHPLSLDAAATAREFARLLAFAAALYATSRVTADQASTMRLLRTIGAMTIAQCLIILAHKVFDATQIYGLVRLTMSPPLLLGTFGNTNHLAGYLTLGVPVMIALALRSRSVRSSRAWAVAAAVASALIVLTVSRSGMIGLTAAGVAMVALLSEDDLPISRRWLLLIIGGLLGVGLIVIALFVDDARVAKIAVLLHPSRLADEEKVHLWRDVPGLIADFWRTGVGRGAFEQVYPPYRRLADAMSFSHVENTPLQLIADLGIVAGVAVGVSWVRALVVAGRRERGVIRAGILAALIGITAHDLSDFSLDAAGAVGLTAAVLWGVLFPAERPREGRFVGWSVAFVGIAGAAACWALVAARAGDLSRDLAEVDQLAKGRVEDLLPFVDAAMARHPAEPWLPFRAGVALVRRHQPQPALRYLNRALQLDPTAWRPHGVIAEGLWDLGRRSQAVLEFRLAYVGANFHPSIVRALIAHPGLASDENLLLFGCDDPAVLSHLALTLEELGHDEAALQLAHRLVELRPADSAARRLVARAALRKGHYLEALAETDHLEPGDVEGALLRVDALLAVQRFKETEALLAQWDGTTVPAMAFEIATRALVGQSPEAALTALGRVKPAGLGPPEFARLRSLMALAHEQKGQMRDAILEYSDAARIDPTEKNRLALAAAYERAGLLREAWLAYHDLERTSPRPSAEIKLRAARARDALSGGILPSDEIPALGGVEGGDSDEGTAKP